MHQANIRDMYAAVKNGSGFDVIIVVSADRDQAEFWQDRLEASCGSVTGRKMQIISVEEDWPGGAGQLLGTLYAWEKAQAGRNLNEILQSGGSVAMYHTAGKGMRMAPLPAAEANNKSAIKLPRLIEIDGGESALTVLEGVIFQTGPFAASRGGRLSVFWGDQIFVASMPVDFEGRYHGEILSIRAEMPQDEETWKRGWQSYGLLIPTAGGETLQREKQTWSELKQLIGRGIAQPDESGRIILGKSLGCFSISCTLLEALLREFAGELARKRTRMDTDPHLWMPLTSSREEFLSSGGDEALWEKLNEFKRRFLARGQQGLRLFGDKDLGGQTLWWDYGQLRLYHQGFLRLLERSVEGECLRQFYDLEGHWRERSHSGELIVENSILLDTQAKGKVKDSILLGVSADYLDISGSVIINGSLSRARARDALIYNCIDLANIELSPGEVMADIFLPPHGRVRMKTELWRDGKKDWAGTIRGNRYSFEVLNKLVTAQPKSERSRWMSYYQDREKIQESLEPLKRGFIKPGIDPVIFQTYDIRAVADEYLSDRVCYYIGKGYGTFLRRQNPGSSPAVAVGGGVRLSTERIRRRLIKGILSTGVSVYDVGITSTPELYFSIPYLDLDGGVNITASHNDAEDNGFKQVVRSKDGFITSISADQMLEIKRTVLEGDFIEGEGTLIAVEEGEVVRYHNELVKANCRLGRDIWIYLLERRRDLKSLLDTVSRLDFPQGLDSAKWAQISSALDLPRDFEQPATAIDHPLEGLKVVIDFGNGSGWRSKGIYSDLGAEVVALNEIPDGSFPAHKPDPIKARYRRQLEQAVINEAAGSPKEVVGIGHDEDGDRVIYVRSDGLAVEGDRTLAVQAKSIIEEHKRRKRPGKPRFIGEVKFSRIAEEFIAGCGGEYIMVPTGHAFIKMGVRSLIAALNSNLPEIELFGKRIDLLNKQPVVLAAELSGHQMSGHEENWIFDDANLAAVKVLTVIANGLKEGKTFIDLDEEVSRYPATPELNIRIGTNVLAEKQEVVDAAVGLFRQKGYTIDTTDGGLIMWVDKDGRWVGQALIRKSNTQPMIICRVEGRDEGSRVAIEDEFLGELTRISTAAIPVLDLASDDYIRGILPRVGAKHSHPQYKNAP